MTLVPNAVNDIVLYRNFEGREVTYGSYSARETFSLCPRKFQLGRVEGWRDREKRSSLEFGKCIESALQFHDNAGREPGTAVDQFTSGWKRLKVRADFKELTYTDAEGDWDSLLRAGREIAKLYEIRVPDLPISVSPRALWQTKVVKPLFPTAGAGYDRLNNTAVLDIISYPQWDHPLLPQIERPEDGSRTVIIDCKTSGKDLYEDLVGLDPQLIEYAWQMRQLDVAFLWLVKRSHSLERKNRVTLLTTQGAWTAGTELFVLGQDKEKGLVFLADKDGLRMYGEAMRGLHPSSKAYAQAALTFFQAKFVLSCTPENITKQRLQFAAARLTKQDIDEAGRAVGRYTMEMVRAHSEQFYPRTGGIRWPNEKCVNCSMRGICADKPELRDRLLTRSGEEWMEFQSEE